jgi:TetR/AcrR family transcriptional repressor of lmrAB and yxaGH operons
MATPRKHDDNLVRSAMRLFRRQGYAATGLQQILEHSGAPRGSLYHYFPDGKESIGAAAVELAGELVAESLEALAAKHATPEAFLNGYCRLYAQWMAESHFQSGCPIATTLLETAPLSKRITAAGRAALERWLAIIGGVFQRAGLPRQAARRRAELVIAALEGSLILARVRRSKQPILNVARGLALARSPLSRAAAARARTVSRGRRAS